MKIYILFQGYRNNSNGGPIAAFRTKKQLRKWVKENYPTYEAIGRVDPNEMYWQEDFYWLKCEDETIKVIDNDKQAALNTSRCSRSFDDWWNDHENGCPTLVLDNDEQFARAVWNAAIKTIE